MLSTKPREFVVVATVPKGTGLDTVVRLERAPWFSTGGRWFRFAWCCPCDAGYAGSKESAT